MSNEPISNDEVAEWIAKVTDVILSLVTRVRALEALVGYSSQLLAATNANVPDDAEVITTNGIVKWKDIPKNEKGEPMEEWLLKYCLCETHVALRKAPTTENSPPTGQYL